MATDFTQDSVLHFLRSNGGRVKNSDLLAHFKPFIKDHENRTRNRELFKKFVNSVAVVKPEEGVSYVVLRKRIQGHVDGNIPVVSHTPETRASRQPAPQERRIEDRSPRSPANRNQDKGQVGWFGTHFARQKAPVPRGETNQLTDKILPAAGIVDNVQDYALPPVYKEPLLPLYNATIPKQSKDGCDQSSKVEINNEPVALPVSERNNKGTYIAGSKPDHQLKEPKRKRSYPPPEFSHTPQLAWVQQNAALIQTTSEADHTKANAANAWPLQSTLARASSTPCISEGDVPVAASLVPFPCDPEVTLSNGSLDSDLQHKLQQQSRPKRDGVTIAPHYATPDSQPRQSNCSTVGGLQLQHRIQQQARPKQNRCPGLITVPDVEYPEESRAAAPQTPPRHTLPPNTYQYHTPSTAGSGYPDQHYHRQAGSGLPASHSSPLLASSEESRDHWPQGSPGDTFASAEDLSYHGGNYPGEQCRVKVQEMLHRAHEAKPLSEMQHAVGQPPRPCSTSYLDVNEADRASSRYQSTESLHGYDRSEFSSLGSSANEPHLNPPVRRIISRLRSRMTRSLGADLDQLLPEDSVSARQNRLHLLSSNLGIGHSFSTPSSRTHSCRDLREDVRSRASSNRSLSSSHDGSYFHRHSQVPLEPNEHDWLVKSATGTWPDVYDLFRDDPSLLTKRDFITGYNILHWIAKHGDHRVLNTLAYGVDKAGLKLDVDAKTACGYTALHLAALHGNKQMVRLLVHKFRANVALRDTSGKKAWQYLSGPKDLLELLGAPNCSTPASSSTPQSPVNSPRAARVKRTTSIAAFLNKTLIKFPGREGSPDFLV